MTDSQKWLLFLGVAGLGWLVYLLAPVLTPFLMAAALAYLGDPLVDRLEARKLSRTLSVSIVFLVFLAIAVIAVLVIVPALQKELVAVVKKLPGYIDWVQNIVLPWLSGQLAIDISGWDLNQLKAMVKEHWQQVGGAAAGIMGSISRSGLALIALLANLVLVPVLTFYLLRDWDILVARIHELIPARFEQRSVRLAKDCDEVLGAFMHGQLMVMVSLGTVYSVGLWIVGLDMAMLIGMGAGLVSFVPYLGFILGVLVAGIAAVMQFQDAIHLVYILMVFGVGQLLESFLLTPYLLGERIGLHPVAVIFAVMAGGQLFGFVGVLIALPVAAVIMVLLRHAHEQYIESEVYGRKHLKPPKAAEPQPAEKQEKVQNTSIAAEEKSGQVEGQVTPSSQIESVPKPELKS